MLFRSGSRRDARVRLLLRQISRWAIKHGIKVRSYSRGQIRKAFAPHRTKERIAAAVAFQYPELLPHLPRPRKLWDAEALAMSVFDAASLAMTFFAERRRRAEGRAA